LLVAIVTGFFGYGLSLALYIVALRSLGAARTGVYFSTAPFVGAVVSVAVLRENVTWALFAAGFIGFASVDRSSGPASGSLPWK
jgi:drug/metabolite transporter (DMT)-like permease